MASKKRPLPGFMPSFSHRFDASNKRDFALGDEAGDEFVSGDVSTSSFHVLHHFVDAVVQHHVFNVFVDVEEDVGVDGRSRHHRPPFHRLHVLGTILQHRVRQVRLWRETGSSQLMKQDSAYNITTWQPQNHNQLMQNGAHISYNVWLQFGHFTFNSVR